MEETEKIYVGLVYPFVWNVSEGLIRIIHPEAEEAGAFESEYSTDRFLELIHPEDVSKLKIINSSTQKLNSRSYTDIVKMTEIRVDFYNDAYRWYEFRFADDDNTDQIKGVIIDIDHRMHKNEMLKQQLHSLEEIEKSRNAMITNLLNKIRTPLREMQIITALGKGISTEEMKRKYSEIINLNKLSFQNILNEIDHLLGSEKSTENEKEKEIVSLWEYMVETQQVYSFKAKPGVRVLFSNPYREDKFSLYKESLSSVIDYILTILLDKCKQGDISMRYELKGDNVLISIEAPSVDLTVDSRPEPSIDDSTNLYLTDHNLKLAMCRDMVAAMGGELRENFSPRLGSVLAIELPVEEEKFKSISKVNLEPVARDNAASKALPMILVAEDVEYNYIILKTHLQDRFEVLHAENGEIAVEMFKQYNPEFVFMDVKMPVMDGIEATKLIRNMSPNVPIVILTAYAVRSLRKEAQVAGCSELLTKPTTVKQINAVIRKYLKN